VIELLQNADAKGLDPDDYDGSRWQGRLLKLGQKGQKPSEQDLVSFDTACTVSAMRYLRAIHCGRVNPKEFKFQLDMGGTTPVGGIHSDPGRECRRFSRRNPEAGTAFLGLPEAARALADL
jgi:Scaffold domain